MIYVMSDIHGNRRRFDSVLEQIDLQPKDTLYVLGDVIDRYPDGIRILRRIMEMSNCKMLLGNHEYMMLHALGRPYDTYEKLSDMQRAEVTRVWYRSGGRVTHQYWKHIRKDIREAIIQYLLSLPLNYDVKVGGIHYKLAHAAPVEEFKHHAKKYPTPTQFATFKQWRLDDEQHGDYTLIFGHMHTNHYQCNNPMEVWFGDRRIAIDCGCDLPEVATALNSSHGRLACLRLDDGKVFYSDEAI